MIDSPEMEPRTLNFEQNFPGEMLAAESAAGANARWLQGAGDEDPEALPHETPALAAPNLSPALGGLAVIPPTSGSFVTCQAIEAATVLERDCRRFEELVAGHLSKSMAARAIGRPVGWFTAADGPYARWKRGGLAGLTPVSRGGSAAGDLTARIEGLGWFIPAARFMNLHINRTTDSGSVPEAVRRVISLPVLPVGWTRGYTEIFLKHLKVGQVPVCPVELREEILARERAGQDLVPGRVARQIRVSKVSVALHRRPHEAGLTYLSSPGTGMIVRRNGESWVARAGDCLTADDGTINFPVCVPFTHNGAPILVTPCTEKYGVLVGRFQWLRSIDVGTRYRPGWVFVARPRSSYRGADVLALLRGLTMDHGVWEQYAFERGVWHSDLVNNCLKLLGAELNTVYSPHAPGKVFAECGFGSDWTKLSVHFPQCDLGRYRGDTEEANRIVQDCRAGRRDPRKVFPMLSDAVRAFEAITAEQNTTPVNTQWGRWVPVERWQANLGERPMRRPDARLEFAFMPYAISWRVRGHLVGGRVPLFEEVSVPFDFHAPWLSEYHGARVRVHFDPAAPKCLASAVLAEPWGGKSAGTILGSLEQVNETAGYVRMVMGWGEDDPTAGLRAKQAAAKAMRRELRTVLPGGKGGARSEEHDGIGTFTSVEKSEGNPKAEDQLAEDDFQRRLERADAWENEHALDLI